MFDVDSTFVVRQRSIYNILDFLGDVGGLQESFHWLASAFLYFFGMRGLQGKIVSSIYHTETIDEKVQSNSQLQRGNSVRESDIKRSKKLVDSR